MTLGIMTRSKNETRHKRQRTKMTLVMITHSKMTLGISAEGSGGESHQPKYFSHFFVATLNHQISSQLHHKTDYSRYSFRNTVS